MIELGASFRWFVMLIVTYFIGTQQFRRLAKMAGEQETCSSGAKFRTCMSSNGRVGRGRFASSQSQIAQISAVLLALSYNFRTR
jgi:hypothetical protein